MKYTKNIILLALFLTGNIAMNTTFAQTQSISAFNRFQQLCDECSNDMGASSKGCRGITMICDVLPNNVLPSTEDKKTLVRKSDDRIQQVAVAFQNEGSQAIQDIKAVVKVLDRRGRTVVSVDEATMYFLNTNNEMFKIIGTSTAANLRTLAAGEALLLDFGLNSPFNERKKMKVVVEITSLNASTREREVIETITIKL